MTDKVMVFIDGSNLYHSLKGNLKTAKIHLIKFSDLLVDGRKLVRVYYYNAPRVAGEDLKGYKAQQKFFNSLKGFDKFELRLGRLEPRTKRCDKCGDAVKTYVEKGVDIMIATDMIEMANRKNCDVEILVSGDSDFSYAVQAAKNFGVNVEVASFRSTLGNQLKDKADTVVFLDDLKIIKHCSL